MSTSLTVNLVFGLYIPKGHPLLSVLDPGEYGDVTLDPVSCMGGSDEGYVLYASASKVRVLRDRDGYDFPNPLIRLDSLGGEKAHRTALAGFLARHPGMPHMGVPGWLIQTDVG